MQILEPLQPNPRTKRYLREGLNGPSAQAFISDVQQVLDEYNGASEFEEFTNVNTPPSGHKGVVNYILTTGNQTIVLDNVNPQRNFILKLLCDATSTSQLTVSAYAGFVTRSVNYGEMIVAQFFNGKWYLQY